MTDTNGTIETNTNGNGTTPTASKESALSALLKEHNQITENGNKMPGEKVTKPAYAKFKILLAERDAAEEAFQKANKAFSDYAPGMVRVFGDFKIDVNGRRYFPASRGETVFYREEGKVNQDRVFKG